MYNSMQQAILLEGAMRDEILKMFNSTTKWNGFTPERQKSILDYIKQFRDITQNTQALHWLIRIIYRALVAFSTNENSIKKRKRLISQGYSLDRIQEDWVFFLDKRHHSQFLPVWKSITDEISTRTDLVDAEGQIIPASKVLKQTLDAINYVAANGIDLPCSEVYNQLNSVRSVVKDSKELPVGQILHQYKDGATWNLINKSKCEVEGRMMHHCGNADFKPGDKILSYREKQGIMMRPKLTFILNNGKLGEMKGHLNAKPTAEFHERIVDLLQNQWVEITHLQGSGYKPQNNFSLNHLNEKLFKQLAQHQPKLVKSQLNASDHNQKLDEVHAKWLQEVSNLK